MIIFLIPEHEDEWARPDEDQAHVKAFSLPLYHTSASDNTNTYDNRAHPSPQSHSFAIVEELLASKVDGMECRLAEQEVEDGGVISLDDKEKDLLGRYSKERRPNDGIGGISPYPSVNEAGVPWCSGEDCNLNMVSDFSNIR